MRPSRVRLQLLLASVVALELVAAPAFAQSGEAYDPWEHFNRGMYSIQAVLDRHIFGPVARGFGKAPSPIRKILVNFSSNLSEPLVFVNDVLQGHVRAAAGTFGRFAMNTTVGLGGIIDVASHNHLPHHDNGFGTTLGRWGADPGPYLFLPLVGPGDLRDGIGAIGNIFLNPFHYARFDAKTALSIGTGVVNGLNTRLLAEQALANIQATSTDPYATLRSYFWQNRAAEIEGNPEEPEALPSFDMPDIPTDESTPAGTAAPPGAPPSISQPPSAAGAPLSGLAGAIARPEAVPENRPAGSQAAPAQPEAPPPSTPQRFVAPDDDDAPMRTAGGRI
jgi:phospholipid-binding lipoprotein MlaA